MWPVFLEQLLWIASTSLCSDVRQTVEEWWIENVWGTLLPKVVGEDCFCFELMSTETIVWGSAPETVWGKALLWAPTAKANSMIHWSNSSVGKHGLLSDFNAFHIGNNNKIIQRVIRLLLLVNCHLAAPFFRAAYFESEAKKYCIYLT